MKILIHPRDGIQNVPKVLATGLERVWFSFGLKVSRLVGPDHVQNCKLSP